MPQKGLKNYAENYSWHECSQTEGIEGNTWCWDPDPGPQLTTHPCSKYVLAGIFAQLLVYTLVTRTSELLVYTLATRTSERTWLSSGHRCRPGPELFTETLMTWAGNGEQVTTRGGRKQDAFNGIILTRMLESFVDLKMWSSRHNMEPASPYLWGYGTKKSRVWQ